MQIYATGMIHGCETYSNLRQSEAEAVITFAKSLQRYLRLTLEVSPEKRESRHGFKAAED